MIIRSRAQAHEAASTGRRLGSWARRAISPNNVISEDLVILRNRAFAAVRDNPWVKRAVTVSTANEIGTGIIPRPHTSDPSLNKQLRELWVDQLPYMDYNGLLTGYGIQAMSAKSRKQTGEVFVLIHRVRKQVGLPVPIQFQCLESEFCPVGLNHALLTNGNTIRTGVEINAHAKPVAYWFHKKDPRESSSLRLDDLHRVPVSNVIHHFIPNRPGALRATPEVTTGLVKAHTFEQYNDAELVRKATRSELTGVIERENYTDDEYKYDPFTGSPIEKDHDDVGIMDFEPGTFVTMNPGERLNMLQTDDAGRGYADYQMWQLLGVAAGVDVPYQLLSGDFREINDRLWRAIFNEYKREIEHLQAHYIIPQICRRMWNEFVNRAVLTGAITPTVSGFDLYRVRHSPQAWEYIQPVQDMDAKIKAIAAGITSRSETVDATSGESSAEDVDMQRAVDNKREDALGLSSSPNPPNTPNTPTTRGSTNAPSN